MKEFIACDLCGAKDPRRVLDSRGLDGPLVQCMKCGFQYVGSRRSALVFGKESPEETTARVRAANAEFRYLRLEEEHRLALLNAKWRLDLIRKLKPSGKLLEVGCARGDFLQVAKGSFDASGVEPNPELADSSSQIAPVYRDIIERTPWTDFDVVASFHVIEHVDSPDSFIRASAERVKPGGLLVVETPNIDSLPFKILRARWRQFIPEHYFFFDPKTISQLLSKHGLSIESISSVGKYASLDLIVNRLARYVPWLPDMNFVNGVNGANRLSRLTFRINPMDIMLVFARKAS